MVRLLKALPLTLAIVALSIIATSCGSSNTQARFVNAIQDTNDYGGTNAALDIDVNGTKLFSDVGFGTASSSNYRGIPAGSDTIEGLEYNSTTEVFNDTGVSLNSGNQYTLVATGFATGTNGDNVILLTPTDNNTEPANGSVSFRVINASPSGPTAVDVWIVPAPLNGQLPAATIPSVAYKSASNYTTISYNSSGGGFALYVAVSGTTNPLIINGQGITVGSVSAGSIRTIVLYDIANGNPPGMNSQALVLTDLN
jgi:hypothetical protein